MLARIVVSLLVGACSAATAARGSELEAYQVADINPLATALDGSPGTLWSLGDVVIFAASDNDGDREPWRSDGTEAGTYRLVDSCSDCSGGFRFLGITPVGLFFATFQGDFNQSLWVTDGSLQGTRLLASDVAVDLEGRAVWVEALHRAFLSVGDEQGRELWSSDGTVRGTGQVVDLVPGPLSSLPRQLTSFKGRLYFNAVDRAHGHALWVSNGTAAGTRLVKDMWPGPGDGDFGLWGPQNMVVLGDRLLFLAESPGTGVELWTSDGRRQGTKLLRDLAPGTAGTFVDSFRIVGKHALAIASSGASEKLLTTDGTRAGTRFLVTLGPSGSFPVVQSYSPGGVLVFPFDDGTHGREPWMTDGTVAGTRLLADICPGSCSSGGDVISVGPSTQVVLRATEPQHGSEPWITDGTTAGTHLLADICPSACSSDPALAIQVNRRFFVASYNPGPYMTVWGTDGTPAGTALLGVHGYAEGPGPFAALAGKALLLSGIDDQHGRELWRTNGKVLGTRLVRDLADGLMGAGSFPTLVGSVGNNVIFFADDSIHGFEPWRSDGTDAGTSMIAALEPIASPDRFNQFHAVSIPGALLLSVSGASGLWRTDGSEAGTFYIGDVAVNGDTAVTSDGVAYFPAGEGYDGLELWRSDGTAAGTFEVADIRPGESGSAPAQLTAVGRTVFFTADTLEAGRELWRSDGTSGGTRMVADLAEGSSDSELVLVADLSGTLLFHRRDGFADAGALWRSDGTAAGTVEVAAMPNASRGLVIGQRVLIPGRDGFWVTDGTPGGTKRLSQVGVDLGAFQPFPVALGGAVYFPARGSTPSNEPTLWRTDVASGVSTEIRGSEGEALVRPNSFQLFLGHLVFAAEAGAESALWYLDGSSTTATRLLPVSLGGALPEGLTVAGERLYFARTVLRTGTELWALRPAQGAD